MAGDPHDDVTGEIGSGGITGQWFEKATTRFSQGWETFGDEMGPQCHRYTVRPQLNRLMCVVKEAVMGRGTGHKKMYSATVQNVEPKNP